MIPYVRLNSQVLFYRDRAEIPYTMVLSLPTMASIRIVVNVGSSLYNLSSVRVTLSVDRRDAYLEGGYIARFLPYEAIIL